MAMAAQDPTAPAMTKADVADRGQGRVALLPLQLVAEAEASVSVPCTLVCRTCGVPVEHLSTTPSGKSHEVTLVPALGQPGVSEGMAELVGVDRAKPGLLAPALHHLKHPGVRQVPSCPATARATLHRVGGHVPESNGLSIGHSWRRMGRPSVGSLCRRRRRRLDRSRCPLGTSAPPTRPGACRCR